MVTGDQSTQCVTAIFAVKRVFILTLIPFFLFLRWFCQCIFVYSFCCCCCLLLSFRFFYIVSCFNKFVCMCTLYLFSCLAAQKYNIRELKIWAWVGLGLVRFGLVWAQRLLHLGSHVECQSAVFCACTHIHMPHIHLCCSLQSVSICLCHCLLVKRSYLHSIATVAWFGEPVFVVVSRTRNYISFSVLFFSSLLYIIRCCCFYIVHFVLFCSRILGHHIYSVVGVLFWGRIAMTHRIAKDRQKGA